MWNSRIPSPPWYNNVMKSRLRDPFLEQALAISLANGHNGRAKSAKRTSEL
jgi:hypothetical protein